MMENFAKVFHGFKQSTIFAKDSIWEGLNYGPKFYFWICANVFPIPNICLKFGLEKNINQ